MNLKGGGMGKRTPLCHKITNFVLFTSENLLSGSEQWKMSSMAQGVHQEPPSWQGATLAAEGTLGNIFQEAEGGGQTSYATSQWLTGTWKLPGHAGLDSRFPFHVHESVHRDTSNNIKWFSHLP